MRFLTLVLPMVLASGCGSLRPSAEDLARIQSVKIATAVETRVTYSGQLPSEYEVDQGNALLRTPVTAPIGIFIELFTYPSTMKRRSQRLRSIFRDAKVDVPAEVQQSFATQLAANGLFPEVKQGEGRVDAEIQLEVGYGLSGAMLYESDWTPWLEVRGRMIDPEGKELWNTVVEVTTGDGDVRPLPFPDPFLDQSLMRMQYNAAAREACARLIDHLSGK